MHTLEAFDSDSAFSCLECIACYRAFLRVPSVLLSNLRESIKAFNTESAKLKLQNEKDTPDPAKGKIQPAFQEVQETVSQLMIIWRRHKFSCLETAMRDCLPALRTQISSEVSKLCNTSVWLLVCLDMPDVAKRDAEVKLMGSMAVAVRGHTLKQIFYEQVAVQIPHSFGMICLHHVGAKSFRKTIWGYVHSGDWDVWGAMTSPGLSPSDYLRGGLGAMQTCCFDGRRRATSETAKEWLLGFTTLVS